MALFGNGERLKLLEKYPKVETHSTGEFRMGTPGYGVVIRTKQGVFDFLKSVPTVVGSDDYSSSIEFSSCDRYIKVVGPDIEYILDSMSMQVSIFKINVRANRPDDGIAFSHEHCVFGLHSEHIRGFKSIVFVQCPWVDQTSAFELVNKYLKLREKQLSEAMNAQ